MGRQRLSAEMVLAHPWVRFGGPSRVLVTPQNIKRNNSARELSAFAESAMAVNRVVLQHKSINNEVASKTNPTTGGAKKEIQSKNNDQAAVQTANPPFGLSPPSESKLIQRRSQQKQTHHRPTQSQSLNFSNSCRTKSALMSTKNSCDYLVSDLVSSLVESPGC